MTNDKQQIYMMVNKKNLPPEKTLMVKDLLSKLDDSDSTNSFLQTINYKDPIIALVISLFFGFLGIDRFYIGDKKKGLIKLILFIVTMVITFIVIPLTMIATVATTVSTSVTVNGSYDYNNYHELDPSMSIMALFLSLVMIILAFIPAIICIIDWFFIMKAAKNANFNHLASCVEYYITLRSNNTSGTANNNDTNDNSNFNSNNTTGNNS